MKGTVRAEYLEQIAANRDKESKDELHILSSIFVYQVFHSPGVLNFPLGEGLHANKWRYPRKTKDYSLFGVGLSYSNPYGERTIIQRTKI